MINISKLYCGQVTPGDWLRYGRPEDGRTVPQSAAERRPIVVWNITKSCNLRCVHCYSDSDSRQGARELSTAEAREVLEDLAGFGAPAVLFSGGEPLTRSDLFELIKYAVGLGLSTVISTNGTLIDAATASKIKEAGVSYVGISLDGIGPVNDRFRRVPGAFERAVKGIRNCMERQVRVGLRLTLTAMNYQHLDSLFDFIEAEGIERACFYHLVPTGRGRGIAGQRLTHAMSRSAVETILQRTTGITQDGRKTDILTVDNHVDGVYLYRKLLEAEPDRASEAWKLLTWNGGGLYSSGVGIGCIDFDGIVHPDQFWSHYDLGDVRQRPFSDIWTDQQEPLLRGLRDRKSYLKGRCRLCRYLDACGGGLRVRADLYFGDPWAPEPECYLTDEQIGLDADGLAELKRSGELYQMPE